MHGEGENRYSKGTCGTETNVQAKNATSRAAKKKDIMPQFSGVPISKPNATSTRPAVDPQYIFQKTNVITANPGVDCPSPITPMKRNVLTVHLVFPM